MGLEYEEVVVTPEIAEEWLSTMGVNRRLNETHLQGLTLAMTEGRWHDDGTPIRFNDDGELIDGQHRLTAIASTDSTYTFMVVRGVQNSAMTTLDTGKSRTRGDVLTIHDPELKDSVAVAATATIALRWVNGARGLHLRNAYVSNDAIVRFYDLNKDTIIHANRVGARVARAMRGVTHQAMSLCAWLFEQIDPEDAAFFWERVIDGVGLEEGSPMLALRRYFDRESKSARANPNASIASAVTIKAWNAYREGKKIQVIGYRIGGASPERFPEPV